MCKRERHTQKEREIGWWWCEKVRVTKVFIRRNESFFLIEKFKENSDRR